MTGSRGVATRRVSKARRVADKMLGRMLRRGRGPSFMQLLTVRGRHSGQLRTTPVVPVVPVVDDGVLWLVSPFGEVEWVRNARAAGRVQLARGDDRVEYDVRELDAHEATPVLRRYLSMPSARFVRRDFDVSSTSDDAAIAAEAMRHPVFALTPVEHPAEGPDGLGRVGRRD
jgi:deazaflavin-dependent oxidoreductase (nitroreductase family)